MGGQQAEERDGGLSSGKGDLEHAAFTDRLFTGGGKDVCGAFGHGRRIFVDMHGKMYGTAASLHKGDSFFYKRQYAIGRMRRKGFFVTFPRRIGRYGFFSRLVTLYFLLKPCS